MLLRQLLHLVADALHQLLHPLREATKLPINLLPHLGVARVAILLHQRLQRLPRIGQLLDVPRKCIGLLRGDERVKQRRSPLRRINHRRLTCRHAGKRLVSNNALRHREAHTIEEPVQRPLVAPNAGPRGGQQHALPRRRQLVILHQRQHLVPTVEKLRPGVVHLRRRLQHRRPAGLSYLRRCSP